MKEFRGQLLVALGGMTVVFQCICKVVIVLEFSAFNHKSKFIDNDGMLIGLQLGNSNILVDLMISCVYANVGAVLSE
jgi:hypothetical protein